MATEAKDSRLTIEVDLSELMGRYGDSDAAPMTLADTLVAMAASRLLDQLDRDHLMNTLRERISAIRDEEIRYGIRPLIANAIKASIQPTDYYGNPKGDPTTLAEVITKKAVDALKKPEGNRGGYGRDPMTLAQQLIKDEVERQVATELRAAIDEAKAEVRDAVRLKGAEIISDTITRMAGVR